MHLIPNLFFQIAIILKRWFVFFDKYFCNSIFRLRAFKLGLCTINLIYLFIAFAFCIEIESRLTNLTFCILHFCFYSRTYNGKRKLIVPQVIKEMNCMKKSRLFIRKLPNNDIYQKFSFLDLNNPFVRIGCL